MDAFIQAVEEARRRLIREQGRNVSVREVIRLAGYDESQRAGVGYHLNPHRHRGDRPHRVPMELVRRLAAVLPISEDELARAAQVAAGFTAVDQSSPDVAYVVSRFFGDEEVTDEEKRSVTARLLQIIAEQTVRASGTTRDSKGLPN